MNNTLGHRISVLRKEKGFTQEELAVKLGVSAQAVSKWENDVSCPDIMLIPSLAKILGVTSDMLLSGEKEPIAMIVPEDKRKNINQMMMFIRVNSAEGDKVNVNLPLSLIKAVFESGASMGNMGIDIDGVKNIDFAKMFNLIDKGVIGKLVEVQSANGDTVEIYVE